MRVSRTRVEIKDTVELHASVYHDTHWVWGEQAFDLWYSYPAEWSDAVTADRGDPFLAAFLVPAMLLNETLVIDAPVSPKLLEAARTTIQDIICCFDRRARRIAVEAPNGPVADRKDPGGNGLFFSMGVDSCYSLVKNIRDHDASNEAVTHLITVEGFDVYLWESYRFAPMLDSIQQVAMDTSKAVLRVTTNLRDLTDRVADWPRLYHGSALASVALGLGSAMRSVRVAASHTYDRLFPLGSHPLLDPLWSTEHTTVMHDGCEANRLEKLELIAASDVILDNLRVCIADQTNDYNCGKCEKCLRTMIGLHVLGALSRCRSLPAVIDIDAVSRIQIRTPYGKVTYEQLLEALGDSPANRDLKIAIAQALENAAI